MIMKFCSDLGHGEHWFVTVRPKNVDQGGWLHRDANFRLKMEFKRNQGASTMVANGERTNAIIVASRPRCWPDVGSKGR